MSRHAQALRVHYRDIFRFVRRRVDSVDDAEDLTQEVFASAIRTLSGAAPASPPTVAWLYTIARRRLADEARRRRVETVPLELVADPEASADDYGNMVASVLTESLARLPAPQRRVVTMRLLEGRGFAEIASSLAIAEEACRMRFMRALEQVRTDLEKEGLRP